MQTHTHRGSVEPLGLICIAGGIFGVRRCSCVTDRPHWEAASHTRLQTQADSLQSDAQQSSQQTHRFPPPPPLLILRGRGAVGRFHVPIFPKFVRKLVRLQQRCLGPESDRARPGLPAAELSGKSEISPFSFNTSALLSTDAACFGNSTVPSFLLSLRFSLVSALLLECKTTTLSYFCQQQRRCGF